MSDNSKEIKSYKDKNAYYRQHNENITMGCFIYSIITVGLMGLTLYGAYLSLPWLSIGSAGVLLILVYNPIRVKNMDVLDNIAKLCTKINFIFGFLLIAYGIVCQMTGYRSDFAHLMLSACFFYGYLFYKPIKPELRQRSYKI